MLVDQSLIKVKSLIKNKSWVNLIKALLSCFTVVWIGTASSRGYDYRKSRRIHREKFTNRFSDKQSACRELSGRTVVFSGGNRRDESQNPRGRRARERESGLGFYDWFVGLVWCKVRFSRTRVVISEKKVPRETRYTLQPRL